MLTISQTFLRTLSFLALLCVLLTTAGCGEGCRGTDLQCVGQAQMKNAEKYCRPVIDQGTDSPTQWGSSDEPMFTRIGWADRPGSAIVYAGDNLYMRGDTGDWERANYFCAFNPNSRSATLIDVGTGRLSSGHLK